ncbi:uncharacterized protein BP5553_02870 [Venustampulla echinocandica]|uniref:Uncharacterized protein n=1 Tax=Venustampulla echinocandica TaxID=2656787 RepID=A0A370TSM6_9HELO|nr:uncharacterized protein BP5553_02870 [Venustampulla echinocandica]RDL38530.1 hypothetical protein BP5553_02870 [Venustampulla echinocandica]
MCYHKRMVFSCGHFSWGHEVRACNVEVAFRLGILREECDTMFSHPMHSLKLPKLCQGCAGKKTKQDGTVSTVKERLQELHQVVGKWSKKDERNEDGHKEKEAEVEFLELVKHDVSEIFKELAILSSCTPLTRVS